jgi:hypothetical protein
MASKISNTEWGLVIGAAVAIDIMQLILDIFAIGLIANRFIDIMIGISLPFYLKLRGVKTDWKKGGSMVVTFLLEFLGLGIDALPFWTGDVVLIMAFDRADKKKEESKRAAEERPNLTLERGAGKRSFNSIKDRDSDDISRAA